MPKKVYQQLALRSIEHLKKKPGYHLDGQGLYLQVTDSGARSWVLSYYFNGVNRELGLGSLDDVSLAKARTKAADARAMRADGKDPIEEKHKARDEARRERMTTKTFKEVAEAYIKSKAKGWKNAKHAEQWTNTLTTYAYPKLGGMSVARVDKASVIAVLEPIWTTKTETASRVRQRIEAVINFAVAHGYRPEGANPARWSGHLDKVFEKRSVLAPVSHHAALPYVEMGAFMKLLRKVDGIAARATEFIILTAARTNEALGATWDELDLQEKVWTVPATRMKSKREHRVPLSDAAIKLLGTMKKYREDGNFIFPGDRTGKPLSNMACLAVLDRMARDDLTVHGFRSALRDWAAEATNHPREVAEAALAHVLSDKTEAAYQRGDLFVKRAVMMQDWAQHCERTETASVTDIKSATARARR